MGVTDFPDGEDGEVFSAGGEGAGVAELAAHLDVEGGAVGDEVEVVVVVVGFQEGGLATVFLEAVNSVAASVEMSTARTTSLVLGGAGLVAGFFHEGLDGGFVEGEAALLAEDLGEGQRGSRRCRRA